MNKFRKLPAAATLAVAAFGLSLAACGGGGPDPDAGAVPAKTSAPANAPASGGNNVSTGGGSSNAAATEIEVVATENKFTPNEIKVKAGQAVTFEVKNEGEAIHNMKVLSKEKEGKDFQSSATISPGKESKFTATFKTKGTYKFQCDYHIPDMVGTIVVE